MITDSFDNLTEEIRKWEERRQKNQIKHTQHDSGHFEIDPEMARYILE